MSIPLELFLCISKRPELEGHAGLFRCVCSEWKCLLTSSVIGLKNVAENTCVLDWAVAAGCPKDHAIWRHAASMGHLDVLKRVLDYGGVVDIDTFIVAAEGGHLETVKWLHDNKCAWDEVVCAYAAQGGHLDVLKWLRNAGCPWNEHTCSGAAEYGRLETLKWAVDNGCPCDYRTCGEVCRANQEVRARWKG